jgi:hypothetical protein
VELVNYIRTYTYVAILLLQVQSSYSTSMCVQVLETAYKSFVEKGIFASQIKKMMESKKSDSLRADSLEDTNLNVVFLAILDPIFQFGSSRVQSVQQ